MSRMTKNETSWSLTILRTFEDARCDDLRRAEYRFGRTASELRDTPSVRLSEGIASLVESYSLTEEALECGLIIEMTTEPSDDLWTSFYLVAGKESDANWLKSSRGMYSPVVGTHPIEVASTFGYFLPPVISIRLAPLCLPTMSWAIELGIFDKSDSGQSKLSEWGFEFNGPNSRDGRSLVLPGPSNTDYSFFSRGVF